MAIAKDEWHQWEYLEAPVGDRPHWKCQKCGARSYTMPSPDYRVPVEVPNPDALKQRGRWADPFAERIDLTCDEYNVWKIMQS